MLLAPSLSRLRDLARGLRAIVGMPDYENYLRLARELHREGDAMTREQFMHDRLTARYDRPGSRCC